MTIPVMEFKTATFPVPLDSLNAPATEWEPSPLDNGQSDAIIAVTGVVDEVKDIIEPGAFTATLARRTPKVCWGHDWNRPIGRSLAIKELLPGDPNLPKTTADGRPWPAEAGAVVARPLLNLEEPDGMRAYRALKFFTADEEKGLGNEATWSIGYKATKTRQVNGIRHIDELDLYEYSPVLHPANRMATTIGVKAEAESEDLETKVRKVKDQAYWGYAVGTPITAHMRPRGAAARRLRERGIVPSRNVGTTTSADANGKPAAARPTDKARIAAAHAEGLFPEPESPARLKARNPKGKDDEHVLNLLGALKNADAPGEAGKSADTDRQDAYQGLLDEGITPEELATDLSRAEQPDGVDPQDWQTRTEDAVNEYRATYRREVSRQNNGGGDQGNTPQEQGQGQGQDNAPEKPKPEPTPAPEKTGGDQGQGAPAEQTGSDQPGPVPPAPKGGDSAPTPAPEPPAKPKLRTVPLKQRDLSGLTDEELAAHHQRAKSAAWTNIGDKQKVAVEAQKRVRDEQARREDLARRTVPAHPLPPQDYKAAQERAIDNRFRAEDIAKRRDQVAKQNAAAEQAEQVAATAPAKIENPPEGSVLVADGRVALKNPGKAGWTLTTADDRSFANGIMLSGNGGRGVKLNKTQASSLAQKIADITDAQGNRIPLTAPDSNTWVPGFRDAQGRDARSAIMAAIKDWADENGFHASSAVEASARLPITPARLPEPGVPDAQGFLPGERVQDIHPGDQVRLPDGSVHTVSGHHLERGGKTVPSRERGGDYSTDDVLDFADGTSYNMGSLGNRRVDVKPAPGRDPDDTRDPGMGFTSASDLGQPLNEYSPGVRREIEASTPDPVPAGTRILVTPERGGLVGDYADTRPRVGRVTDSWTQAGGNWFQVVEYDDGTFDAINASKLQKDGKLKVDPTPQEEDAARKQWNIPGAGDGDTGPEQSGGKPDRANTTDGDTGAPGPTPAPSPEPTGGDPNNPAPSPEQISRDQIEDAEATVDATLGLTEDPDGNLEVDPDVAERQDRVESLLQRADAGQLDLSSEDDTTLESERRDLVNELRLQNAIAQRDRTRGTSGGQDNQGATGESGGSSGGSDTPDVNAPEEPTGPKLRPSVAGAAEDLADALEGNDPQARADAIARMESSLRRSRSQSAIVAEMLAASQRDGGLAAAIKAGDITPATLRKFAEDLRDERRQQRNTAARQRRTAKRLERDRIKSLIGQYDAELRRRNLNPADFGGDPPAIDGEPGTPSAPSGPELPVGAQGKA